MKRKLIILALIVVPFISFSQNFESIVSNSKKWNILFGIYTPGVYELFTRSYTIREDTIINELVYSKIYINNTPNNEYIREDENNKVYYKNDYSEERLIYDFSLNIEDEIVLTNMFGFEFSWTVVNVDTIWFAEKNRKRITLSFCEDCLDDYWIEGIGSTLGLIYSGNFMWDFSTDLLCFYQNEELLYSNSDWNSCYITVSIPENKNKLNVFPNPTNNFINIETTEQIESLTIIDITGRLVLLENNKVIDLSMLNAGIYFLRVKTNNDYFIKTIIKN